MRTCRAWRALGGAVVSVAAKLSGTLARPMASVMVEGAATVTALGSFGWPRSCAEPSRSRRRARRWDRRGPRPCPGPAPQSTTSRTPSAVVAMVSLPPPATSTSEPGPRLACSGVVSREASTCRSPAPVSRRTRALGAHWKPWNFGLTERAHGVQGVGVVGDRDEEPGLVGRERDVVGGAGDVGQRQPARVDAGLQGGAGRRRQGQGGEQRADAPARRSRPIDHP